MSKMPSNFNSSAHRGIEGIEVKLLDRPDPFAEAKKVAEFFWSTWGAIDDVPKGNGWLLTAQKVAAGKGLPNALEAVVLTFTIEGISRATTHQLVRSRVGVGFGQQGGRDNDWSGFNFRVPETWHQLAPELIEPYLTSLTHLRSLYKSLIEQGVPYQDARYCLPMGMETALVGAYNLLALKGTLQRRLCNRMMWSTNYVARLMADLTVQALPWVGRSLRSTCEQRGVCGSVSPMFPPSCITNTGREYGVSAAQDNPTLIHEMGEDDYDWPLTSNGCWQHFNFLDRARMSTELKDPVAISLVDGVTVLTERDTKGIWHRVN